MIAAALGFVRYRIDQAYTDKLDGKISEEFWSRKEVEWQTEEQQILFALQGFEHSQSGRVLSSVRILGLVDKAYFLYLKQNSVEKAKLLRIVLSNCAIDAVSVYPTYGKPFDLIFHREETEEWCCRRESTTGFSRACSGVW